jgi:hypothetical protein
VAESKRISAAATGIARQDESIPRHPSRFCQRGAVAVVVWFVLAALMRKDD